MNFETIKKNFDHKLWSIKMVAVAVKKGVITPAQFKEITGQVYQ